MKKIILLALVCTGFVVTTPSTAHALDSEKISQNLDLGTNIEIAQYRRNQNRDSRSERLLLTQTLRYRQRQFSVYYRNRGDRQWTLEGYHPNRRDAQQAANRLQRRGYRTYVQVSRRVTGGMNRG